MAEASDRTSGAPGAWRRDAAWILAGGLLALGISGVFSGVLHLSRRLFIVPHLLLTGGFAYAFLRANAISLGGLLRHRWRQGVVGAMVLVPVSLFEALQGPASPHAAGWRLAWDLLWSGVVYGVLDALLLTVVPVLAASRVARSLGWVGRAGRVKMWSLALAATFFVTVLFHVGFPEYRGPDILGASFGNEVLTVGFLASGSAVAPIVGHAVLHVAAVMHGPATTPLLPPHTAANVAP